MVTDGELEDTEDLEERALCLAPDSQYRVLGLHQDTQVVWCIGDYVTRKDAERVRAANETDVVTAHIVDDHGRHRCVPRTEGNARRIRLLSIGRYGVRNGGCAVEAVYALFAPQHCYVRVLRGMMREERTLARLVAGIARREGCDVAALRCWVLPSGALRTRPVTALRVSSNTGALRLVRSRIRGNERAFAFVEQLAHLLNGRAHS